MMMMMIMIMIKKKISLVFFLKISKLVPSPGVVILIFLLFYFCGFFLIFVTFGDHNNNSKGKWDWGKNDTEGAV